MESIEEPLSKRQREEMEGIVAISTQVSRAGFFLLFVLAVGALFRWIQHLAWQGFPVWVVLTVAASVWVYVRSVRWTGGPELRRKIREDLAAGTVVVSIVEPESVEEVGELEDEGPSFIVRTLEGNQFLLTGQEMGRYKSKEFPWRKFGVIETPRSRRFLGLRRMGEPMPVSKKHPPFTYQQAKHLGCFQCNFIELDESKRKLLSET